jgi:hypothetical protein
VTIRQLRARLEKKPDLTAVLTCFAHNPKAPSARTSATRRSWESFLVRVQLDRALLLSCAESLQAVVNYFSGAAFVPFVLKQDVLSGILLRVLEHTDASAHLNLIFNDNNSHYIGQRLL